MAPQEPEQGSWLPGSLRGLAPQEPEPGRLLPGVTIYHHPISKSTTTTSTSFSSTYTYQSQWLP